MPHSYWLRPRTQRINYSEKRPYRKLRSIPSSKEYFMAQRMVSAAAKLELTGDYLMNNTTTVSMIGAKRFCTKTVTTVMKLVKWMMQATAHNVTSIVTSGRLTHHLPIFILLIISGFWIISGLLNMSQFPRIFESLNTNFLSSLNSQSSVICENKYEMIVKEPLQNSLAGFSHIRSDVKDEISATLAKESWIKEELAHFEAVNEKLKFLMTNVEVLGGNVDENNGMVESVVQQTLMTWLHGNYISRSELDSQLGVWTTSLTEKFQEMMAKEKTNSIFDISEVNPEISESFVRSVVDEALVKFNADKTGMPDFALESGGGSVISTHCSETFTKNAALISIFGLPLYYKTNSPRTAIQADVNVGECWPFKGSTGTLVIKLSHKINITGFSIEHIPKSISPLGHIESAPKDFSVYRLTKPDDDDRAILLGNFIYKDNDETIQQFFPQVTNVKGTQFFKLLITSNHGNLEYTCLYRFRVHGVLPDPTS